MISIFKSSKKLKFSLGYSYNKTRNPVIWQGFSEPFGALFLNYIIDLNNSNSYGPAISLIVFSRFSFGAQPSILLASELSARVSRGSRRG